MKQFTFLFMVAGFALAEGTAQPPVRTGDTPIRIDVYTGGTFTFPGSILFAEDAFTTYGESDAPTPDSGPPKSQSISLEPVAAAKITFSRLIVFGAARMKDTSFADWAALAAPTAVAPQLSYSYGAKLHLGSARTRYAADVLAGTLRFSQAASRLKNPCIASGSALRRPGQLSGGISPELPTRSSQGSGTALSICLTPARTSNGPPLPAIEAAYTAKGEWLVSAHTTFSGRMSAAGSACITAGMFRFGGQGSTSWFSMAARFPEALFPAGELDWSLAVPFARCTAALGLHGRPFGGCAWWFRTQGALTFGQLYIGATFFAGDSGLYTADGTLLRTLMQASLNPQCTFTARRRPLRIGVLGTIDFRIPKDRCTADNCTAQKGASPLEAYFLSLTPSYKLRFDASYRLQKAAISAHTELSLSKENGKALVSAGAAASRSFEKMNASLSTGGEWSGSSTSYSASASFSESSNSQLAVTAAGSVSTKAMDGTQLQTFRSGKASVGLTLHGSAKQLKWTGKMAFLLTF